MKKIRIVLIVVVLGCMVGLIFMYLPKGRRLGISTKATGTFEMQAPDQVTATDPFTIKLSVDTKGESINAVGLKLKFPTNRLQILSMDTKESFCEFYPENRYDNQTGEISISCGLPNPGFNGVGSLATITFEPLSVGVANLEILPESAILLNDGKATNILKEFSAKDILIVGNL